MRKLVSILNYVLIYFTVSYVVYFFIDNHSHSLSLNQCQRVINSQWLSDEVHYCGLDFDFDQNYFLLFFRS